MQFHLSFSTVRHSPEPLVGDSFLGFPDVPKQAWTRREVGFQQRESVALAKVLTDQWTRRRVRPDDSPFPVQFDDEERRVIGVVETAKIRTLGEAPRPFVYMGGDDSIDRYATVVATTRTRCTLLTIRRSITRVSRP